MYSLGFSDTGVPLFTLVAQTNDAVAPNAGVGPPTITTFQGQAGTAILWQLDPDARLRAYYAVPMNGQMIPIPLPASPAVSKFQRPVFGNGRYYIASSTGDVIVCLNFIK